MNVIIGVLAMVFRNDFGDQIELGRGVLANVLDRRKPLYELAVNIDWKRLESAWAVHFSKGKGRTTKSPRLIACLMIISYLMDLSDKEVVEQFTQNPYYQFLCGELYFTQETPCHQTCLCNWRQVLGVSRL